MLDTGSQSITIYDPVDIPRKLQIEPYIREALTGTIDEDGLSLDTAVRRRLGCQSTSLRTPPSFSFYVHETALLKQNDRPVVLHEQILHLLITSSLSCHHIRLIPADSAAIDIRMGFTLYQHDHHRPVIHHQQPTTSLFLEHDHDVAFYRRQLERIASKAVTRRPRDGPTSSPVVGGVLGSIVRS
ncbi:hypothetical protein DMH01_41340 [Amycolatopsis sp. WAC 04182]|uniref:DUF5753 domain-containing protein n=1 Tax=Amycolatopsis sp. WAC 04182 TaxID=2203198 RepID=UPI000F76A6FF|nr:DUF5753 domain-containing protein [Amycolatopsis sp. WAC 04182]RSN52622.1 hypothetical protein DMH01_41340 [Amycolatopsis sp. WAC 04182]